MERVGASPFLNGAILVREPEVYSQLFIQNQSASRFSMCFYNL